MNGLSTRNRDTHARLVSSTCTFDRIRRRFHPPSNTYNACTSDISIVLHLHCSSSLVSIIGNFYIFEFSLRHDICRTVRLCLHFVLTRIYIMVCVCVLYWCMCVSRYVCTWRITIFFYIYRMKTLPSLSFWRTEKKWILYPIVSLLVST
jgi:hypothetical protein